MRQVVQSARTGRLELVEVPAPVPDRGQVLVRTGFSVVSPGTEKLSMDFARKSLLAKARSRPDLVRQTLRKLSQEGPLATYRTVTDRLDAPQPLGYSCSGVVESVGEGVSAFAPGDRVACGGAGWANHAEWNCVPENLVARVPEGVSLEQAAFATVGAIALQGMRLARPTLGEVAAVIGLGLIGQLAVQLLRANGCRVLGLDTDPRRAKAALAQGAEWAGAPDDPRDGWLLEATEGQGVDLAVVAASASSSAPIELAAGLCRAKGRISLVGAMPMDLDRRTFYEKELELQVSMSYGPGRYDRRYEELGLDYPLPYVRWTENRNLQAFLALVAAGSLHPDRLDTETAPLDDAERVYAEIASGERRTLSVVFDYGRAEEPKRSLELPGAGARARPDVVGVGFLGAGNYAKSVLLPALSDLKDMRPVALATATGASARRSAERFGFARCGTEPDTVLAHPEVDLVFVATRHDSHATLAAAALRAGKAVWLEKPVALTPEGLDEVLEAARAPGAWLTVGYNRRFSRHARALAAAFAGRSGPLALRYTVAAGAPPAGTWITDPSVGGGRVVGELCHFVDLATFLVGAPPTTVYARSLGRQRERDDSTVVLLGFRDGSTATIEYLAAAGPELPKERIEVSGEGRTARCDNFRSTQVGESRPQRTLNQDKGQATALAETLAALRAGRPAPIPLEEIEAVSRATFAVDASLRSGLPVELS